MDLQPRCQRLTHYFENGSFDLQSELCDRTLWTPTCAHIETLQLSLPIATAIIYDTLVQHGDAGDKDSLSAIIKASGPRTAWHEVVWLERFLTARWKVLFRPQNRAVAALWLQSAPRVSALRLLLQKHPDLRVDEGYERTIAKAF